MRKSKMLEVPFTGALHALISEAAAEEGQTVEQFVRKAALDAAEESIAVERKMERFEEYLFTRFGLTSGEMADVVVAMQKTLKDIEREERDGRRGELSGEAREQSLKGFREVDELEKLHRLE